MRSPRDALAVQPGNFYLSPPSTASAAGQEEFSDTTLGFGKPEIFSLSHNFPLAVSPRGPDSRQALILKDHFSQQSGITLEISP